MLFSKTTLSPNLCKGNWDHSMINVFHLTQSVSSISEKLSQKLFPTQIKPVTVPIERKKRVAIKAKNIREEGKQNLTFVSLLNQNYTF